jgi:hypothetical protein
MGRRDLSIPPAWLIGSPAFVEGLDVRPKNRSTTGFGIECAWLDSNQHPSAPEADVHPLELQAR